MKSIALFFLLLIISKSLLCQNIAYESLIRQLEKELNKYTINNPKYYDILTKLSYISPESTHKFLIKIDEKELDEEAQFFYKNLLTNNYLYLSYLDSALQVAHELNESVQNKGNRFKKTFAYLNLSECYILKYLIKDAKLFALKAYSLNENGADHNLYLKCIIQLAKINYFEKNFAESIENCYKAQKILDIFWDGYEASKLYMILGNIQKEIGNNDLAIYYYNKAIQLDEFNSNYISLSKNLGFLSLLYYQDEDFNKSLNINKKGLEIARLINNKISIINKLVINGNNLLKLGKLNDSFQNYQEALSLSEAIHYIPGYLWSSIGIMEYFANIKSYQNAKIIMYKIKNQIDSIKQSEILANYYKISSVIYYNLGDFKNAYDLLQKFYMIVEQDLKQNIKNKITQLGVIFQAELHKKENEFIKKQNEVIQNQNQLQKVIIFLVVFLLIISLIFVGYLYNQKSLLNELNFELQRKNEEIQLQKEEIIAQTELLKKQKEELEVIDKYKSQLFAIITHDLKMPIANLQMLLSILEKKELSPEDFHSYIQEVKNEVDNSYELLQNFIFWTKSRLTDFKPKFKVLYIYHLIKKNLMFFESNLHRKNIQVDLKVDEELLVWADEQLLNHVIYNILSNAIKFSYANSILEIWGESKSKYITIHIKNYGKPMSKETIKNLFQINHSPEYGTSEEIGTGIGLYLSSEFMKKMDGKITCDSKGDYTEFSIYIPMADD